MDPATIVSVFGVILQVVVQLDHIRKEVKSCTRTLKYAKDEFKHMTAEIGIFVDSMEWFSSVGSEHDELDSCSRIKASKLGSKIAASANVSISKIEALLDDVQDLRDDADVSEYRYWIARWKWRSKKQDIVPILQYLNTVKQNATFLGQIMLLELMLKKKSATGTPLSDEDKKKLSAITFI